MALGLGPTNPTPSNVASETLGISANTFCTCFTLLVPAFSLLRAPTALAGLPSLPAERSPTTQPPSNPPFKGGTVGGQIRRFGAGLSPVYFRRRAAPPVSFYALLKGWLLLSQPPGRRRDPTSLLYTEPRLGGLSWRSGLFPSRQRSLPPLSHCQGVEWRHSEFGSVEPAFGLLPDPVLYLRH